MTQITIDKGVPVPDLVRTGRPSTYPFAEMLAGDSFFTANKHIGKTVTMYKKRNPSADFTTRKVEGGFRVWRIK